jgi:hypothetical protein
MTGYQNVMRPLLATEHGLVSFDQVKVCMFVIVDGHRLGLEDNICVEGDAKLSANIGACKDLPS